MINFRDWPLERSAQGVWATGDEPARRSWLQSGRVPADYEGPVAADYPLSFAIVRDKVQPQRAQSKRDVYRNRWWLFAERQPALQLATAGLEQVLVVTQTSKYHSFAFSLPPVVCGHKLVSFSTNSTASLAALQATLHTDWVLKYGSSLETRPVYTPSDCFETFPFPVSLEGLDDIGGRYDKHRRFIMSDRREGLTKTYNCFHDPENLSSDIIRLRELHVEMDNAVAAAYGWFDLALDHGFYETKQGLRFTVSPAAHQEILDRLLELNHERYAEEVAAGLHRTKGTNRPGNKRNPRSGALPMAACSDRLGRTQNLSVFGE